MFHGEIVKCSVGPVSAHIYEAIYMGRFFQIYTFKYILIAVFGFPNVIDL